ncbi:MGDG synthase family glycosyltransferase [Wukongibacter sp. M2B1]|uniref:MGDG synthase family glycosyltransferase n=1 Tax=Wukongibacter sp. M2B1 TaxID=3088895 RepID=UPI003D7A7ADF
MRKVLIFTASTGGGHNQAAKSLSSKLQEYDYEVVVVDILKLTNKVMEKVVVEGYEILSCSLPIVYRGLYKYSNKKFINTRLSKYIFKIFKRKIYKSIREVNPDLIVGTHPFIVNIVSGLKRKKRIFMPFISIVTDFKAHSSYFGECVDAYITGSEYTNMGMIDKGIEADKLYCYGIPIRQDFLFDNPNIQVDDKKDLTVLLMGGSMGITAIEEVLEGLVNCEGRLKINVVCGNNKVLFNRMKSKYSEARKDKEINIYGFTNEISNLMDRSDILISKPGGLTVSEAIAKRLPILIPYMLPGQEEENAEFLSESGIAMIIKDIEEIDNLVGDLIDNPENLKKMKKNMDNIAKCYSIDSIIDLGEELINKYEKAYALQKAE